MRHPDRKLPQPAAAFIGKLRPLKNHSEAAASLDRHMLRYLHHGRSKIGTASLGCMCGSAHNYSICQASTRVQRLHAGGGQIKAPCGLRGLGVLCGFSQCRKAQAARNPCCRRGCWCCLCAPASCSWAYRGVPAATGSGVRVDCGQRCRGRSLQTSSWLRSPVRFLAREGCPLQVACRSALLRRKPLSALLNWSILQ
jgi:hypothetical protein